MIFSVHSAVHDLTKTVQFPTKITPRKVVWNFSNINNSSFLLQHHTDNLTGINAKNTIANK